MISREIAVQEKVSLGTIRKVIKDLGFEMQKGRGGTQFSPTEVKQITKALMNRKEKNEERQKNLKPPVKTSAKKAPVKAPAKKAPAKKAESEKDVIAPKTKVVVSPPKPRAKPAPKPKAPPKPPVDDDDEEEEDGVTSTESDVDDSSES